MSISLQKSKRPAHYITGVYSEPSQISKMELFAKTVNGFKVARVVNEKLLFMDCYLYNLIILAKLSNM